MELVPTHTSGYASGSLSAAGLYFVGKIAKNGYAVSP